MAKKKAGKWGRGFWKELFSRSNVFVNTLAFLSLLICAPFAAIASLALIYDIFYLGNGLTDSAVKLISIMVGSGAAGLTAGQFSKRTYTEMLGTMPPGESSRPPGRRGPKPQGEQNGQAQGN